MTEEEEWREVLGFENEYEASSLGRIRSKLRPGKKKPNHIYGGKILVPNLSSLHLAVTLSRANVVYTKRVHQVVCEAFHGPKPPDKDVAAHWDGDPLNNRSANLRWATYEENEDDKRRHGRHGAGAKNPGAKITPEIVADILANHHGRYGDGARLARKYGISTSQVCDIAKGRCWSDEGNAMRRAQRAEKKAARNLAMGGRKAIVWRVTNA